MMQQQQQQIDKLVLTSKQLNPDVYLFYILFQLQYIKDNCTLSLAQLYSNYLMFVLHENLWFAIRFRFDIIGTEIWNISKYELHF